MDISMIVKASVAAIAVAVTGCATQKDLEATRAVADRAVQDAEVAKTAADAAMHEANQATASSANAQSTANQALQGTQTSQACCDAVNEKLNRAFQKAMTK